VKVKSLAAGGPNPKVLKSAARSFKKLRSLSVDNAAAADVDERGDQLLIIRRAERRAEVSSTILNSAVKAGNIRLDARA